MAACNATDRCRLPFDSGLSSRGTVWPDEPIRRSVVSIPSNIAEGQGRLSKGEFRQFLGIARGSNCEVQTQLEIARALKIGNSALIDEAETLSNEVRKMLFGMLDSLNGTEKLRTVNSKL